MQSYRLSRVTSIYFAFTLVALFAIAAPAQEANAPRPTQLGKHRNSVHVTLPQMYEHAFRVQNSSAAQDILQSRLHLTKGQFTLFKSSARRFDQTDQDIRSLIHTVVEADRAEHPTTRTLSKSARLRIDEMIAERDRAASEEVEAIHLVLNPAIASMLDHSVATLYNHANTTRISGSSPLMVCQTCLDDGGGGGSDDDDDDDDDDDSPAPSCSVPSSEVTSLNSNTGPSVGFQAVISNSEGDNWTGHYVWEVDPSGPLTNSNTCYWAGNPDNMPAMPSIALVAQSTGQSYWTVETGNMYGIDFVGFTPQTLIDIVRLHPASVTLACTYSVKQEMEVECNDSMIWQYKLNQLTMKADVDYWYQACRDGVCASGTYY